MYNNNSQGVLCGEGMHGWGNTFKNWPESSNL